jgi:peptide/nickel transport system permease protein
MGNYIIRRIIIQIGLLFIIAIISFSIIHLIPGNPVVIMLGESATPERIDDAMHQLGLDKPVHIQFINWIKNVFKGDFGDSIIMREPVLDILARRFPRTFWLAIFSMFITVIIGAPMGIIAALNHNKLIDRVFMIIATAFLSIPIFVLALGLMLLLAVELEWFPVAGQYVSPLQDFWGSIKGMFLPALSISSMSLAYLARMARSAMLEIMNKDFITTARAKGVKENKVISKHMLKPASIPVVSTMGIIFGGLLGGTIISETVFVVPGIGRLMYESVLSRDYVIIQSLILLVGISYSLVNLITDILYSIIDPRISYS